jgi:uncharacterized membrane protein YtjA (UPF0391 family)
MKKRFSLPTFLCGAAVLVLLGFPGIAGAKANAPLFRAFVIYSKASDHIVMSTRAKSLIQRRASTIILPRRIDRNAIKSGIYFVKVTDARTARVQTVCLQ